ncbi:uncharacterized protein K452DRAFT_225670 [Aplosporella prunicola CBS 121167]|uniref:Origin recognition complex subunit 2 n=1 Tax=Aplosporella prunicola CBS 121167 TaxID=1176127 RepID=A0A6A6BJV4_9PEZI|nr:uncharacterized protein K452DRAFT_225670 [Aplosporella prunicola CBS 121167]KAF2142861.1 hypothetical protein K452DRAFT_225670 [Aplosporella prunicola CBS 121167]
MPSVKRRRAGDDEDATTPRKRRASPAHDDHADDQDTTTPSRAQNGVKSLAKDLHRAKLNGASNGPETPRSQRRVLFATPSKHHDDEPEAGTPTIVRNADRSARRKSARRLLERTINGDPSDDEEALEEENALARQIWDEDEADELGEDEGATLADEPAVPETPSKRGRGRPKGSKNRKRSLTPPGDLPPNEQYFYQNRPGGAKTSNNTLPSHSVLNHDEYFAQMQKYKDPHDPDKEFLLSLHSRSFDQWAYELEHGFNICLYGYGSKRGLAEDFASHLYQHYSAASPNPKNAPKIIIINGYNPALTAKDILTTILTTLVPSSLKLPAQAPLLLNLLLTSLSTKPPTQPLTLVINSMDAPPLRRPGTQPLLAQLAAHPSISLVATADSPIFPLLWDQSLRSQLRLLFHDCTTFAPYAPVELDAVEAFNELLGRSGRRVAGRDGVGFVLRSLPENARGLFRILVAEQLAATADDDDADAAQAAAQAAAQVPAVGVEYRVLYHKAVEEFVCSNEMSFRTLLKEFHDHQMIESRKDAGGVERLWVPFRREDLESLLEELV